MANNPNLGNTYRGKKVWFGLEENYFAVINNETYRMERYIEEIDGNYQHAIDLRPTKSKIYYPWTDPDMIIIRSQEEFDTIVDELIMRPSLTPREKYDIEHTNATKCERKSYFVYKGRHYLFSSWVYIDGERYKCTEFEYNQDGLVSIYFKPDWKEKYEESHWERDKKQYGEKFEEHRQWGFLDEFHLKDHERYLCLATQEEVDNLISTVIMTELLPEDAEWYYKNYGWKEDFLNRMKMDKSDIPITIVFLILFLGACAGGPYLAGLVFIIWIFYMSFWR